MVNNGVFVFDRSDALTYAGAISGTGSLVKNGVGTLTLTGVNPYSGGTTINAGRLVLNNAVVPGPVEALPDAFLGGNGSIGPATFSGTLSPGASIGTITVIGDLTFMGGSTYIVEISPTASDRTDVTGTATLDGFVQVIREPGIYVPGTVYTIVSAASLNGVFEGVSSNFDIQRVFDTHAHCELRKRWRDTKPDRDWRGSADTWRRKRHFRCHLVG
jgi:autotransporter-associated beta strand protein